MFDSIQAWDLTVLTWMRGFNDPAIVQAMGLISNVAWKGWLWWLIIGACWLRGQRDFAARVGLALSICVVAGLPMKSLIARARPDLYASQQLNLQMPELLITTHSFPSGHTLMAAAFAFVVYRHFRDYRAVLAFLFVALVGVARIHGGYHWPTDIIFSVVLGWVCAFGAERLADLPLIKRFTTPKAPAPAPVQEERPLTRV